MNANVSKTSQDSVSGSSMIRLPLDILIQIASRNLWYTVSPKDLESIGRFGAISSGLEYIFLKTLMSKK